MKHKNLKKKLSEIPGEVQKAFTALLRILIHLFMKINARRSCPLSVIAAMISIGR
jgi:hypothetical protein